MRIQEFCLTFCLSCADDGGEAIDQAIQDGCARIISDGSYKPNAHIGMSGTSVIHIAAGRGLFDPLEAVNWVTSIDQSPYTMSELVGVYGTLSWQYLFSFLKSRLQWCYY